MTWLPGEALSLMPTFIEALPRSRCPISALHRNDAIHIINLSPLFHVDLKKKKEASTSPNFFSYLQLKVFFSMRVGRYKSYLFSSTLTALVY